MSERERVPLQYAAKVAGRLVELLAESCKRIEIAGSVRRRKETVKDVELVVVPKVVVMRDLFGTLAQRISLLDAALDSLVHEGVLDVPSGVKNGGERMKKFDVVKGPHVLRLDLFIVLPPAQWGSVLAIRTGPMEFSKWLVTEKRWGGAMPAGMVQVDGALYRGGQVVETPEERDYFEALGVPWMEPWERKVEVVVRGQGRGA